MQQNLCGKQLLAQINNKSLKSKNSQGRSKITGLDINILNNSVVLNNNSYQFLPYKIQEKLSRFI